jgi:[CysO sulfur-carrier protein]-S-L-cysteine hydrolase
VNEVLFSSVCLNEVIEHVLRQLPEEACGLLAGKKGLISKVIPIENQLHSKVRFQMEAKAQLEAFAYMDQLELDLIAIFHSHPDGPMRPSEIDIREHAYPDALCIICFPDEYQQWSLRAFLIENGTADSTPINFY